MPIISIESDPQLLTLTAIGEYTVPLARLWQAWADPRQLERFWGPPCWPATFVEHDLRPGGRSRYFMTGPNGECARGIWVIDEVVTGSCVRYRDSFANDDWQADTAMPESKTELRFEETSTGSRFVAISTFASVEAMEQLIAMGMLEGMREAIGQLDALLDDLQAYVREMSTALEIVDDTHVAIRRVVRGTIDQVWRAHHDAELLRRWCYGPDGWSMVVCEVGTEVGAVWRYEWVGPDEAQFGFTGEVLEIEAPRRSVTTERMVDTDGPGTQNTLTLTPRPGRTTLIENLIEYPSAEVRDMILATGMVDGMEMSYTRIDALFEHE